jgi:peptidoglycan-N-acetylglucosamine deacetylase
MIPKTLLLLIAAASLVPLQAAEFRWPAPTRAAVCLTYDDASDSHLDVVGPDLAAAKLRGTFYVSGRSESLWNRVEEWRALARQGHELGNHTIFHPCRGDLGETRNWLLPEQLLERYSPDQYASEAKMQNTLLLALDGLRRRTFAYTCCELETATGSVVDPLRPLFPSARGGPQRRIATDFRALDLFLVPAWDVGGATGEAMIKFVQEAVDAGGLAVLMFHGVGGRGRLTRQAHQDLLKYLSENRNTIWTDTFLNITDQIISERKRLKW